MTDHCTHEFATYIGLDDSGWWFKCNHCGHEFETDNDPFDDREDEAEDYYEEDEDEIEGGN